MSGPAWDGDDPADGARVAANARSLVESFRRTAPDREVPTLDGVLDWHRSLYAGCSTPCADYLGHLRGDPAVPELADYDVGVGVGPLQPDGLPVKRGVWFGSVLAEVEGLLRGVRAALDQLDALVPVGSAPVDPSYLHSVLSLCAVIHGEWVRIHPFANGNGRMARLWVAFISLRYGLPVFLVVKPRPQDSGYALAAAASMGRPPDFRGDHQPARNLFASMLEDVLARASGSGPHA